MINYSMVKKNDRKDFSCAVKIDTMINQNWLQIPENHLLMQAMLFEKSYEKVVEHTESIFHMNEKKQKLQEHFAKKD